MKKKEEQYPLSYIPAAYVCMCVTMSLSKIFLLLLLPLENFLDVFFLVFFCFFFNFIRQFEQLPF